MSISNLIKKSIRIFSYAKPYWSMIMWLFFISIALTGLSMISPYLVKVLIDDVLISQDYQMLLYLMGIFILIFFFKTLVSIYFSYQSQKLAENIVFDVKTDLFKHMDALDLGFHYSRQLGDILVRLDDDTGGIQSYIDLVIDSIFMNILTAIFILGICLYLSWQVTLASLTFFPFYVIIQKYFGEIIRKKQEALIKKGAVLLSFMQEHFISIKAVKSFLLENKSEKTYGQKSKNMIQRNLDLNLIESYSSSLIGLITFTPLIIILWYGSYKVMAAIITVGELMALYTYIGKLFGPVSELGSINIAIQSIMVSVNRVFQFMDRKPKIADKPNAIEPTNAKFNVSFNNVHFSYDNGEKVLSGINFSIKKGETLAIVGESGAGKSTITNLLCRFWDVSQGSVLIDEHDIRNVKTQWLRKNIGLVSQDTITFNATIKENIKVGNPTSSLNQIIKAAKLANIHTFISTLPKGYDTMIGERGVNLSGGQQQRIAIARTILKNPKIIIFDEATSSLDSKSENKIQDALDFISKDRTTIIIAHRLSTIKNADKIILIENKKIAESGTFDSLMDLKGKFYQFYRLQSDSLQSFKQQLHTELDRSERLHTPLSFSIIDINNVEKIRHKFGTHKTLAITRNVKSMLQSRIRDTDFMTLMPKSNSRFFIAMPETTKRRGESLIKKIVKAISQEYDKLELTYELLTEPESIAQAVG